MNVALPEAPAFQTQPGDPRLANLLRDYPPSLFGERLYQSIELLERYSLELAVDLFRRLELINSLGQWRSAEELCRILSYQPLFRFALRWILERLVENGCIEARTDHGTRFYHWHHEPWQPELMRLRDIGIGIDPANAATLDLLDHAASFYPAAARGELSVGQSLFGVEGIRLWLNYFHNDNRTYAVNNWVTAILAAEHSRTRSRLRILEIGAGAGSASEILLRCLDERGLLSRLERYHITEPNAFFRRRAQRELMARYADLPLEWGGLDLNLPWKDQGIAAGEFNIVYAVNVFHISQHLLFSLNEARLALTNGGCLILGECLRPRINQPIYPELMFQILDSFTDVQLDGDIRPNPGFLTAEQWRRAFAKAGFAPATVVPDVDSICQFYPHFFTGAIRGQSLRQ